MEGWRCRVGEPEMWNDAASLKRRASGHGTIVKANRCVMIPVSHD
ncbi:hypothetical protein C7S15_7024 [Burkholderia cepacia]|nr:hypothetical protein [Burkholderia cepacia]